MNARQRLQSLEHRAADKVAGKLGGRAPARVVVILAGVLALDGADRSTVSASEAQLQQAFGISTTQIGLLISVVPLVGALASIPIGALSDRTGRTRLIWASIALWAVATLVGAVAQSYVWLLVSRVALGAVTATAGPPVTSLTGDYFPARARGRMWGYILSGELIGTAVGFIVSGELAALVGWRVAFAWLVIPAVVLAWAVYRLPEPARGGQERLQLSRDQGDASGSDAASGSGGSGEGQGGVSAAKVAQEEHIPPRPGLVLHEDPSHRSIWWAFGYVLRVRTNLVLIIASALGYFYFEGLRSFAFLFVTRHYGISQTAAGPLVVVLGVGGLIGVIFSGRLADRWLSRGRIRARVIVPTVSLLVIAPLAAPALITTTIAIALPLLVLTALFLGAVNSPLDAARLDIMPPRMWGRAESARTLLRRLGEAVAPTLFGFVAGSVFAGPDGFVYTFLIFLIALVVAGLLGLVALRTYPRDVATAGASAQGEEEAPG